MKCRIILAFLLIVQIIPLSLLPFAYGGPYRSYDSFMGAFLTLANDYPGVITVEKTGKTVNNADIILFKIGNPNGETVLFDGAIHGWESQGGEILYLYAKWLVSNSSQLARMILANTYTLLVPALNADSYNVIRKNANGVDLNRNFATRWEFGGSANPASEYYRGPSPLSEPESQALARVFRTYSPRFYVNIHSGGGPWLYACSDGNSALYSSIFSRMDSLSEELGVSPYPRSFIGGGGEAMSYAISLGTTSFVLELGNGTLPFSDVQTAVFPRFMPVAVTLSLAYELLFKDDFESDDFSMWDGTDTSLSATAHVTTIMPREGDYSASFVINGNSPDETADCYVTLGSSQEILAGAFFLVTSSNIIYDDGYVYFIMFGASDNAVAYAGWRRSSGVLRWRLKIWDGTVWSFAESSISPSLGHWYYVELHWYESSTNGHSELYVDGVPTCQILARNTTAYGSVDSVHFGLAASYNGGRTAISCDYVQVSKTNRSLSPPSYDMDVNGRIDMQDVAIVAVACFTDSQSPNWNPRTDLDADRRTDMSDVATVARHFGEE